MYINFKLNFLVLQLKMLVSCSGIIKDTSSPISNHSQHFKKGFHLLLLFLFFIIGLINLTKKVWLFFVLHTSGLTGNDKSMKKVLGKQVYKSWSRWVFPTPPRPCIPHIHAVPKEMKRLTTVFSEHDMTFDGSTSEIKIVVESYFYFKGGIIQHHV